MFDLLANVRKKREGGFVYSFKLEENNMKAEPPHIPSQKDGFEIAEHSAFGKGSITQPEPIVKKQLKKTSNRTILANALDTTAQNDIERNKLTCILVNYSTIPKKSK